MSETPNLALPYLAAGQAQKHVTLNEQAEILDTTVHLSVLSRTLGTPPASPSPGARYLLPSGATGAWQGQGGKIASWNGFGWRFLEPRIGWMLWDQAANIHLVFDGMLWLEVGNSRSALNVPMVGVNTVADNVNRLAVKADGVLLSHDETANHGDMRAAMNKKTSAHTVSQVYQTGYSGRAETGLMGNDQFAIKVSTDGATWKQALTIDPATGVVSVPFGIAGASGVHAPVNIGLSTTVASGALTISLTTNTGAVPSGGSQSVIPFRSATANSGEVTMQQVFAQNSLTISSGSILGVPTINSPFALWVVAFNDAGTVRLGVINCRSDVNIFPLGRANPRATSTAEGGAGAADSAHTFYTGTAVTAKAYCILGRLEWSSGLATLGTWTVPTLIEPWHPTMKLPGDVVQLVHSVKQDTFTSTTTGVLTDIPGLSASITPTSAANLVKAIPRVQAQVGGTNGCAFSLIRGSTNIGGGTAAGTRVSAFGGIFRTSDTVCTQTVTAIVLDAPNTAGLVTYKVQFALQGDTLFVNRTAFDGDSPHNGRHSSSVTLEEIQV